MPDKKNESKTIKALTVLSIFLVTLDVFTGGYFAVKALKSKEVQPSVPDTSAAEPSETAAVTIPSEAATAEQTAEQKDMIDTVIDGMSLHEKICQMFIICPEDLTDGVDIKTATEATSIKLKEFPVGGLIYFEKNLETQNQIAKFIADTKGYANENGCIPLFYGVDEEGGQVARCADAVGTVALDSMYYYKELGVDAAQSNARMVAGDIAKLGFDLDFAPVADTWSNPSNKVIGTRAYSDDFKETAKLVEAAVKGFKAGGMHCVIKHFPGHGDTEEDSHYSSAVSYRTADELRENEYLAFKSGIDAGADMVMVGHIIVPSIDELPATLSEKIIQGELRNGLGYDGVVITDSLAMGAITNNYSSADAAVMAVKAGNDILLMPDNFAEAVTGIENAVQSGELTEERINESVKRILDLKRDELG